MIVENIKQVEENIKQACEKVGRNPEEVTLIAVSKTKPYTAIEEALPSGILDYGENKVQELCDKFDILPKNIRWHMIGHLQRNKVKYLVGKVQLIHSVDSLRLAEQIEKVPHVRIQGLMTIAPFTDNPETNRVYFKNMKKLSVDINNKNIDNVSMNVLSMGMTGDYQVAVEEGATMVRVGTGIFGERNYNI